MDVGAGIVTSTINANISGLTQAEAFSVNI